LIYLQGVLWSWFCIAACRLEVVADPETLTQTVLKVLPVCTPAVQQQLIGFLPEIVQQQDHEVRSYSDPL